MSGKKILVIGDVMLDHYVYGSVNRMSPEAPVPVLDVEKDEWFLGGAGIVASTLAGLGAHVHFLSVGGGDSNAARVGKLLSAGGISALLAREAGRRTTVKERFVRAKPKFEMLLRADTETREPLSAETEAELLAALEKAAEGACSVVISDYAKGMLTERLVSAVLDFARRKKLAVVVDTKGDIRMYRGENVILVPNLHELAAAAGREIGNEDADVRPAALALSKSSGSTVVVKRSGRGASVADAKAGMFTTRPSMAKKVVNVSGAGDIFVAILAFALASGSKIDDAVKLANAGCAIAIAKPHPAMALEELEEARRQAGQ